ASLEAAELLHTAGVEATVVNCRFLKPYDQETLEEMVRSHPLVVTLEEGQIVNGFGAYMAREIAELSLSTQPRFSSLGIPDDFIEHGARNGLLEEIGLDPAGIARHVAALVARGAELETA
ncbi:MAG: transketolase C-terminal domain-containing protein, partial [Longimicrobiales bacterium]|nr:transketolase C-terminal domain-containing protein [Longimicrobiales bacterium]